MDLVVLVIVVVLAAAAVAFAAWKYYPLDSDQRELRKRRRSLDIKPLDPQVRSHYADEWARIQARFVDGPRAAVEAADLLVAEVLRARGYPPEDFEHQAGLIALDHKSGAESYRQAHDLLVRANNGSGGPEEDGSGTARSNDAGSDTEDLRVALIRYRELFDELIETESATPGPHRPGQDSDKDSHEHTIRWRLKELQGTVGDLAKRLRRRSPAHRQ